MKLSRLSNRQLRRLLARGEVRFGDDKSVLLRIMKEMIQRKYQVQETISWLFNAWQDLQKTEYTGLAKEAKNTMEDVKDAMGKLIMFSNHCGNEIRKK